MGDSKSYFIFSNKIENLLFKDVSVSSTEAMVGLCFGVAAFTLIFEVVKSLRHYLVILQVKRRANNVQSEDNESERKKDLLFTSPNTSGKAIEKLKFHCLQTLLHMLQLAMGYMVMLIVMSYNAWLLITVIITTATCFYFHEYVLSRKSLILPLELPGSNL